MKNSTLLKAVKNKNARSYIEMRIEQVEDSGLELVLSPTKKIKCDRSLVSGYFCEVEGIKVAMNRPLDEWFPVFIHETCHFDQFREKSKLWTACKIKGKCAYDVVNDQMKAKRPDQELFYRAMCKIRDLEYDCEKRSVQHIIEYDLPIDVERYTQAANAYMYMHNVAYLLGRWQRKTYTNGMNGKIVKSMPKVFPESYDDMPVSYVGFYEKNGF